MSHSFACLYVHFVWSTEGRAPLITPPIEPILRRVIAGHCEQDGCQLIALGIVDDHVHLLVRSRPSVQLSELIRRVKGGSAWAVNDQHRAGRAFRWQGSYSVFSVSKSNVAVVEGYVSRQREHHARGELHREWELDGMPEGGEDSSARPSIDKR